MSNLEQEIVAEKKKLDDFLNSKIGDQSWLLGFFQQLHPKFLNWIIKDFNCYFHSISVDKIQVKFNTIDVVQRIWCEFHYPIIKYFQYNHALILSEIDAQFKNFRNDDQFSKFKVKPVEIRKINDSFLKFSKHSYQFYHSILKHFATHFHNPLLPDMFLRYFSFELQSQPIDTGDTNTQANLLYVLHRSLVALGDISRHRSFIEVNYVNPCISNKEYFKFKGLHNKDKATTLKPYYEKSLQYYNLCILLLPALNEPYNHIGVIHNLIDDKYHAILWFLRSQFTRIPHYKLGLDNLVTILKKRWFLDNLRDIEIFEGDKSKKRSKTSNFSTLDELNIVLVCLCCFYYLPDVYKRGSSITTDRYIKLEKFLLQKISDLILDITKDSDFMLNQLVVLFSFSKLMENKDVETLGKFNKFAFRYIDRFWQSCDKCKDPQGNLVNRANIAIITRFILNWIKENKIIYRLFQKFQFPMQSMKDCLNLLIMTLKGNEISTIASDTRPCRSYYFKEDVMFKDFLLIRYQFKDFKDDALFAGNNINLLVGDQSSLIVDGVPKFLSTDGSQAAKPLSEQIEQYETSLRVIASVVLGKKLLQDNTSGIEFDSTKNVFIGTKTQKSKMKSNKEKQALKKESKLLSKSKEDETPNAETTKPIKVLLAKRKEHEKKLVSVTSKKEMTPEPKEKVDVPFSIEDIQKSISTHTSQLQEKLKLSGDNGLESAGEHNRLETMVESIISDSKPNDGANATSNIWGVNQPQQPFKIPNLESKQQFYNSQTATPSPGPPPSQSTGGPSPVPVSVSGPTSSSTTNFYQPYPQYTQYPQYAPGEAMVSPYVVPPFVPNQFSPFNQPMPMPVGHGYGQYYQYEQYQPYYMNPTAPPVHTPNPGQSGHGQPGQPAQPSQSTQGPVQASQGPGQGPQATGQPAYHDKLYPQYQ
jgi:telomere elongation protein